MSFTASYPILNHLIVVLLEKITSFPIAVVFRVWSLVTIILASVGLYFLTFKLTKNQTVSGLAAIFYLFTPITWIFLLVWGFAADQLSYIFIPPVLIFTFLFLDNYYQNGLTFKTKLFFLFLVVSFSILPLAHPNIFAGLLMFTIILFLIYPLLNYRSKSSIVKQILPLTLISVIIIFLLTFFWTFPYLRYQSAVARGAPVVKAELHYPSFMHESVYPASVFGLTTKTARYESLDDPPQFINHWPWRNVTFTPAISSLALIGLIGSIFFNRKILAFGLANLLPLIIAVLPQITFHLMKFPFSGYFLNWRVAIIPSRFIIPLLAGYGCFVLARLISSPLNLLSRNIKPAFLKLSLKSGYFFLCTLLTLSIAAVILWKFKNPPAYPSFLISYGPEVSVPSGMLDTRNILRTKADNCFSGASLTDVFKENLPLCQNYSLQERFWTSDLIASCKQLSSQNLILSPDLIELCGPNPGPETVERSAKICSQKNKDYQYSVVCSAKTESLWKQLQSFNLISLVVNKDLLNEGRHIFGQSRIIFEELPNRTTSRVNTNNGGLMMVEPFYNDMPQLPVYFNQGTLIKNFWNYQINVFNDKASPWPQDSIVYELSKYFGLEYTLMQESDTPFDKYERADWERIDIFGDESQRVGLWRYNQPAGLLRVTTTPLVLVIGQDKVDGYFRIFHLANLGTLPFEEGLIVKGGAYADAFSAEELKKFDAVVLEGYSYKNQSKGWKILDEYVKKGGSLLINTGWQYSSADWKLSKTPEFFPLKTLEWTDAGMTDNYKNENSAIAGEVDIEKFAPLIYGDKPWSISSSEISDLRDWAKVVISANGKPLIAGGEYGSGRIVWLGFDLPGHIGAYKDNEEEVKLYKNVLSYLLEGKEGRDLSAGFSRNYPDKLEITIKEPSNQKAAIYFSEAYYPDFKAKLVSGNKSENLKVYKAGPGMTLFILPQVISGAKIIYEYKTPISIIIARTISLATFVALIVTILRPSLLRSLIGRLLTEDAKNLKKKFMGRLFASNHDEDINY